METKKSMYANYQFSITDKQQGEWQTFLRLLPEETQNSPVWEMLHSLSYTQSWTESSAYSPWRFSDAAKASEAISAQYTEEQMCAAYTAGVNRGLEEWEKRRREGKPRSRMAVLRKLWREWAKGNILGNIREGKAYWERRPKAMAAKAGA